MSRSYKKHVVVKDSSNTIGKAISRRIFRAREKQATYEAITFSEEDVIFPEKNFHVYNPYNVVDWVWRLNLQKAIIDDIVTQLAYERRGWDYTPNSQVDYYYKSRRK